MQSEDNILTLQNESHAIGMSVSLHKIYKKKLTDKITNNVGHQKCVIFCHL